MLRRNLNYSLRKANLVINTAQLLKPPAESVLQVPLPVQQAVVQADPGRTVPADGKLLDALRQARESSQPKCTVIQLHI